MPDVATSVREALAEEMRRDPTFAQQSARPRHGRSSLRTAPKTQLPATAAAVPRIVERDPRKFIQFAIPAPDPDAPKVTEDVYA